MILLLAPEKLITSSSMEKWLSALTEETTLFTTASSDSYRNLVASWESKVFTRVEFFKDYANNDLIELKAVQLHAVHPITKIIPMSEADILRAARLRERLSIKGQSMGNALLFRDKVKMKTHAQKNGVPIARFCVIRDTVDLIDFIEEVGYPVVIKPILGRGSLNTFLIKNPKELSEKLNQGFISNTSRYPDLLVEEYLPGDIYHIDGLQVGHVIRVLSASKYVNNCLDFVNGAYLGSYTLENENILNHKILEFCKDLITRVFILPVNSLIHIEVFVNQQEDIHLCEIACRIGGNGINDEVALRHAIDIKMSYIRAECGLSEMPADMKNPSTLAGRLLMPPQEGSLVSMPKTCSDTQVLRYQSRGIIGGHYKKMQMSNDEIANFLLVGNNEAEIQQKITELAEWFYRNTLWQSHASEI